jgi:hypothetical protein
MSIVENYWRQFFEGVSAIVPRPRIRPPERRTPVAPEAMEARRNTRERSGDEEQGNIKSVSTSTNSIELEQIRRS